MSASARAFAHRVDFATADVLDVLGPTIQILTEPAQNDEAPCVMRGTIPPGVFVPVHGHPDPETFLLMAGAIEALTVMSGSFNWIRLALGDVFHVPGCAKHAFRNRSDQPAVMIITTTSRLGRFFREIGTPVSPETPSCWPPQAESVKLLQERAQTCGHWLATPEENARVGLPPI